jgi:spermidine/putrescine transport system substrate-binding protein
VTIQIFGRKLANATAAALLLFSGCRAADTTKTPAPTAELHIYTWEDYTNPALIKRFEQKFNVKVTVDTYNSNEAMLKAVRAGTAYDIAIPSDYAVQTMVEEGLLERTEPARMENFQNLDPKLIDVFWDSGRHYSVPWQYGVTSYAVDTAQYSGPADTLGILYAPPIQLKGRINMLDDSNAVILGAERYLSLPRCTVDEGDLTKIEHLLQAAKPYWASLSYNTVTKMTSGAVAVTQTWNGAALRMREKKPSVKFVFTEETMEGWMDNVVVLKGTKNIENARRFQNFIMDPENAALITAYARYYSGVLGTYKYLGPDLDDAPEVNPPPFMKIEFAPPCPPEVVAKYNRIWARLKQ